MLPLQLLMHFGLKKLQMLQVSMRRFPAFPEQKIIDNPIVSLYNQLELSGRMIISSNKLN